MYIRSMLMTCPRISTSMSCRCLALGPKISSTSTACSAKLPPSAKPTRPAQGASSAAPRWKSRKATAVSAAEMAKKQGLGTFEAKASEPKPTKIRPQVLKIEKIVR